MHAVRVKGFVLGQLMNFLLTKEPTISLKSVSHLAVGQDEAVASQMICVLMELECLRLT